ncbi:MAG: hypothetical protein KGH75_13515, partial [Rhodospirillales bacterium]|nr:hypothetical protein [Rhodospirillales bacterium]
MEARHFLHLRLKERESHGPHVTDKEHIGINGRLAVFITDTVGTMWCAYVFAAIALVSLPEAIKGGV